MLPVMGMGMGSHTFGGLVKDCPDASERAWKLECRGVTNGAGRLSKRVLRHTPWVCHG